MEQKRKFVETIFMKQHCMGAPITIHVNLHEMAIPIIFGETIFVEVPRIHEIYEFNIVLDIMRSISDNELPMHQVTISRLID